MFIARRQSYHGNTLGALAVGGNEWRRRPFAPLLMDVPRVAPCYEYRDRAPRPDARATTPPRCCANWKRQIIEAGPENVIAFCAEPVVGATGGAIPPTPGYFRGVRAICDKYGVLFIADEVMCGMGRTGTMYSIEQDGVAPDIITVAKGLGAGYQPIGAVLAQGWLVDRLRARQRHLPARAHLHRPSGGGGGGAGGAEGDRARRLAGGGAHARGVLDVDAAGCVRRATSMWATSAGAGCCWRWSWCRTATTKQPFAPERKLHAAIKSQAMAHGLMVYPMGGTIDGQHGDHVLLAPPFIATDRIWRRLFRAWWSRCECAQRSQARVKAA